MVRMKRSDGVVATLDVTKDTKPRQCSMCDRQIPAGHTFWLKKERDECGTWVVTREHTNCELYNNAPLSDEDITGLPEKALFVPLKKEYFHKIKGGKQDCEIRPNNHRGWNVKNVYPGRMITFSNGYGRHERLKLEVRSTMVTHDLSQEKVPQWHIDAVEQIYGKRSSWLIAYIT